MLADAHISSLGYLWYQARFLEEMVGISKDVRGGNTVPLSEGILTRTDTGKTRRGFSGKRNRRNSFLTDPNLL